MSGAWCLGPHYCITLLGVCCSNPGPVETVCSDEQPHSVRSCSTIMNTIAMICSCGPASRFTDRVEKLKKYSIALYSNKQQDIIQTFRMQRRPSQNVQ